MSTQATDLDYPDGDITCKGRYFSPGGASGASPVVLVCPAWDGVIPEVMDKAARIADQGYIAMVVDVLGNDLGSDPINAPILVLHGHDDPLVPPEQVTAFTEEMNERQADWQLIAYGNTVHAFTRPGANIPGHAMYNESTDRRSWQAMHNFLAEVL